MSSSAARQEWRDHRTQIVRDYCTKNDLGLIELNNSYQLRIENVIDIYPTAGRWHVMATGERGDWHTSTIELMELFDMAKRRSDKVTVHDVTIPETDTQALVDIIEGNNRRKRKAWYVRLWRRIAYRKKGGRGKWDY